MLAVVHFELPWFLKTLAQPWPGLAWPGLCWPPLALGSGSVGWEATALDVKSCCQGAAHVRIQGRRVQASVQVVSERVGLMIEIRMAGCQASGVDVAGQGIGTFWRTGLPDT